VGCPRNYIFAKVALDFENLLSFCVQCIVQDDHPEFDTYFESDHMKFLEHAEQRLKEMEALPGPVVTIG
jgi:hypothetical protein